LAGGVVIALLALITTACARSVTPSVSAPTTAEMPVQALPAEPLPWDTLDDVWGPYLAEREWGNPREATRRDDGWSFTYEKALTTPYRFGEDGIAGITDRDLSVAFSFAFFSPGQPYLTERLYGVDGPTSKYGEDIREDRVFYENTPTHSYMRYGYNYPYQADFVNATIEYAKYDSRTMVVAIRLMGLANAAHGPLHVVPEVWFHSDGEVIHADQQVWDAAYSGGHFVVVADQAPDAWQITPNEYPRRAVINAELLKNDTLAKRGEGNKAAWDFVVELAPEEEEILRFGLAFSSDVDAARSAAEHALERADDLIAMRRHEAQALYRDDVTEHQDVYQAALMNFLWNKMYYAYDGSYQPEWKGEVDVHDVIMVPDRWEFPWPAMWDTCFQAKVATLADIDLAKHDLRLFLSDRWQTDTGHVPNVEWMLQGETPPLFAWAAWQVYQVEGDPSFLEELFARLEMHYAFVGRAYDRDNDGLHTGGFMGMDNLPRPGPPDEEEADLSGWVALFARDMARIAEEIGLSSRADFYRSEYDLIVEQINNELWDEETGFYYDRNAHGFLLEKSYAGLVPLIAGAPDEEQTERIVAHLVNSEEFWTPYGIRSLSADSDIYEPGHSESGWKNSNWRGPIWMPLNYLIVQRLEETHPAVAYQLRKNLVANVEAQWRAAQRFWEYYHAETGEGLGADHQTGWTALVSNLVHEDWGADR
jgi:hypothetical protein